MRSSSAISCRRPAFIAALQATVCSISSRALSAETSPPSRSLLAYFLKRGCGLGNVNVVRHRAHGESSPRRTARPQSPSRPKARRFLDDLRVLGRRADDDRRKQRLAHYLPALRLEAVKYHALVRRVLVDEHKLVADLRKDIGIQRLADHAAGRSADFFNIFN